VTRDQVQAAVAAYLQGEFGKLLVVRDLRRVHHVTGVGWKVRIVAPLRTGDVDIAELEVDERGVLSPLLDPDGVVEVLRSTHDDQPPPSVRLDSLDLGGFDMEEAPLSAEQVNTTQVLVKIRSHLMRRELDKARELYPRLLTDPEVRASALLGMADIERKLDNRQIAIGYLEAAAREFADRFDLEGLEDAASATLEMLGQEAFVRTPVHQLLERGRARIQPIISVTMAPALAGATSAERSWLEKHAEIRTLKRGEFLLREGEPSRAVFVIRSGILAVLLEKPEGGQRVVRCCFPGWLLGESSVLSDGDPRATASLRAERITEVFRIDASLLKTMLHKSPELRDRLAQTKQIHRIDSFFAMHETMGQLDAQVRDDMLACLERIQTFEEDTLLFPSGEVPQQACLVARGELALHEGWELDVPPRATIGVDRFANVRDAIHSIESPFTVFAKAGSTIAFFDGKKLQRLAEHSAPHVAAVLERLG
jgi:CRP-like cAMP-binding protein